MSTRLQIGILSAAIALSMVGLAFSQEPAPGQGKGQFKGKGKGKGRGGPVAPTGPTPRRQGWQTRSERPVVPPLHAEHGLGAGQGQSRGRPDRTERAPLYRRSGKQSGMPTRPATATTRERACPSV